jgi:hypothetical protein
MDPMLQWILIFESRERILARSRGRRDRVPAYVEAVDAARLRGLPTPVIGERNPVDPRAPQHFEILMNPSADLLRTHFPFARDSASAPGSK